MFLIGSHNFENRDETKQREANPGEKVICRDVNVAPFCGVTEGKRGRGVWICCCLVMPFSVRLTHSFWSAGPLFGACGIPPRALTESKPSSEFLGKLNWFFLALSQLFLIVSPFLNFNYSKTFACQIDADNLLMGRAQHSKGNGWASEVIIHLFYCPPPNSLTFAAKKSPCDAGTVRFIRHNARQKVVIKMLRKVIENMNS